MLACGTGWYGVNCSQPCVGHCRDGITCNHVTGLCDRGCDAGWTGYMCSKGKDISMFFFRKYYIENVSFTKLQTALRSPKRVNLTTGILSINEIRTFV